jgi:hypothetical protein
MVNWRAIDKPYRVMLPSYLELPPDTERWGMVVGEHDGVGLTGPLLNVAIDGYRTVAARKLDCINMDEAVENAAKSGLI